MLYFFPGPKHISGTFFDFLKFEKFWKKSWKNVKNWRFLAIFAEFGGFSTGILGKMTPILDPKKGVIFDEKWPFLTLFGSILVIFC